MVVDMWVFVGDVLNCEDALLFGLVSEHSSTHDVAYAVNVGDVGL